ncbi:MAG: hypothetical protein LUQ31_04375 [Methanoregula sp.]|nr:hypothetical protein [Methanoregula sp.]
MTIPCPSSVRYLSRPPDPSAYHGRSGASLTGTCQEDAILRSFILPPEADPDEFYGRVNTMASEAYKFIAMLSAVRIHIFDYLETPVTSETVARNYPRSDQIPELLRVLCDCGFVREEDGTFVNTPLAAVFLERDSPYSQEEYIEKLRIRTHELWLNLPEIIRTGPVSYDKKDFFSRMVLPPMAANAITGRLQHVVRAIMELPGIPQVSRMLDLGGGHGLYAIALARLNPGMRCTVFDLPEVVSITREYIAKYAVEDQVSTLAGDFFRDDIGSGYDLILSSSNPSGKNSNMIERICASLGPEGYFVNVQGGDSVKEKNCISELEGRMWRFSDEPGWRNRGETRRPFLSDHYLDTLAQADMEIVSIDRVPDPFRNDDAVTMIICQKPSEQANRIRFPMNRSVYGFIHPPWEGEASCVSSSRGPIPGMKRASARTSAGDR